MARSPTQKLFRIVDFIGGTRLLREEVPYRSLSRFWCSKADDNLGKHSTAPDSAISGYNSEGDDNHKWKPDIAWVAKALEPALQLYKWALPAGNRTGIEPAPVERSLSEIFASIRRSKLGVQDWSLSDLTIGLYLLYLRQASTKAVEDPTGEVVSSESIDDIIPRLSVASLKRLRKEIVETDWVSAFKNEDWTRVMDLVENAKQVVSSVQDVAQKLTEYAKFKEQRKYPELPLKEEVSAMPCQSGENSVCRTSDELFLPGRLYYLKRKEESTNCKKPVEYFTLLRRHPGEHPQRILLSSNIISDHRCDSHYYALRDVLKGLPTCLEENIFSHE